MREMHDIYAVIWCDFIPLWLHCANEEAAISYAKDVDRRAKAAAVNITELRAVRLRAHANELETLWTPE
jgi:hypothetical protein